MKKAILIVVLAVFAVAMVGGVMAGGGDEHYYNEEPEQPGIGIDYGAEDAGMNEEMPQADRTRNKD